MDVPATGEVHVTLHYDPTMLGGMAGVEPRFLRKETMPKAAMAPRPRTSVAGSGTAVAICHVVPVPYSELTGGDDAGVR